MTDKEEPTEWYYLIQRNDGKNVSLWPTRHKAVGWVARYHDARDYEITPIPAVATLFIRTSIPDHDGRVAGMR